MLPNLLKCIDLKRLPPKYTNGHIPPAAESKHTLQVLEPCLRDELCISMSQCHSLNPEFMDKTGLNPKSKFHSSSSNLTEPIKIKRCKYERSGIKYLCCKKPEKTSFSTSHTAFPSITTTPTTFHLFIPEFTSSKPFPVTPTQSSSLVTGVGLRFHSGLHTDKQKELNSKKPNPYKEGEQPIILLTSPPINTPQSLTSPHSSTPSIRFIQTTQSPPKSLPNEIPTSSVHTTLPFSKTFSTTSKAPFQAIPSFARVTRIPTSFLTSTTEFTSTTPPPQPPTSLSTTATTFASTKNAINLVTETATNFTTTTTTTLAPTAATTEGPVDIHKIPLAVPLQPQLKENPPIGYVFKGEDLFIPELKLPSQNFLLPVNDFEERTFPTDESIFEEHTEQRDLFSSEATTIYSLLDESEDRVNNNHNDDSLKLQAA